MSYQVVSNPPVVLSANPLWVAVFAAVIVHIILVLGVQIPRPEPEQFSKSIDITLVNAPITKDPEKTQLLAEENQLNTGEQQQTHPQKPIAKAPPEKIKPVPSEKPIPKPLPEKIKPIPQEKLIPKKLPEKIKPTPQEKPKENLPQVSKPEVEQKMITQNKAEQKIATPSNSTISSHPEKHRPISAATLQQQISEMGTEIRQAPPSAVQTKTKHVNQVSANKYVVAQYLSDWETKVERIGNLNYPEAATKPGFSAKLTMEVAINADGSIRSMRITQPSGNSELDEAAKKIVQMSAPFPPLPTKLRSELDVLVITRNWKFSDQSGLITQ